MKSFIHTRLLWILLLIPLVSQAKDYDEGIEYTQLEKAVATQTGDKIEILEFFWYGCPHCFAFEPVLKKWKKTLPANVQFIRLPAPINPSWMVHTKAYYTLQIMGEGDKYHDAIFNAMHIDKKKIYDKQSIADFLASKGVDKEKFLANFSSFAVEMQARQALQLSQQYKINSVPTLAINGKYTISGTQAGGHQGMLDVANFLIKKETK
ncbi:Periplasmic thiol:disulfide interchange protein DsbA [hydrothermal vent metagenome]|uniref:Thiol:disulfide interchange protein DsbA n=1 Tax=hydrothermal vent metagenome TaxID=652676 RepID=A0A3B0Y5A4_9ZZZZ